MSVNIVVTGGAGFIGSNLCRELLLRRETENVRAIDNLSTGNRANLADLDVEVAEGSVLDTEFLCRATKDADAIVHLAARPSVPRSISDPVASHEVNVTGTLNVLERARRIGAYIIVASSSSVYGSTPELPRREDQRAAPQSPYAASKLAAESYTLAYASTFHVPALAFRFFNVYGPFQSYGHPYAAVIPAFIRAALERSPIRIQGDGDQTRDFTYVGSVVDVLAEALFRRVTARTPVNLAFGGRFSLNDVVMRLESLLGRPLPRAHEPARSGDVRDSQASTEILSGLFDKLSPVPFDEGLKLTLQWYQEGMGADSL